MEVASGVVFASKMIGIKQEKEALERLSNGRYNFAIIDKKKDELIGNIGFPKVDLLNKAGVIGLFIGNKEYWGKGYGVDAINLILDYGFNILNLHNISLTVYSFNKPAIKCYKKVGFREAGRLRGVKCIAGKKYDEIFMDILASEYQSVYIEDIVNNKSTIKDK